MQGLILQVCLTSQVLVHKVGEVLQILPNAVGVRAQLHLVAQRHLVQGVRVVRLDAPILEVVGLVAEINVVEAREHRLLTNRSRALLLQ